MNGHERQLRQAARDLKALARTPRGRSLLQLALRGIQESGRGLTYGCWAKRDGGVSGCLFQHAYWQGLKEGAGFEPVAVAPVAQLKRYVGDDDFALVMAAIRAFDGLGRGRFRRWRRGRFAVPIRGLDEHAWRATIERLLIEALAATAPADAGMREPTADWTR